jgi:diguanylate cyclase (GGDEF)-like protein/PAS domain S-box-containing protein
MPNTFWEKEFAAGDRSNGVNWAELAAEAASLGYWRLDVKTEQATWSDGLYRLLGQEKDSPANMEAAMGAFHADDRLRQSDLVREAIATARPFAYQVRQRQADGSWRVFASHVVCKAGPDGTAETLFGVVMDVTEREIYRVLTEGGNDVIIQTDLVGRITYISPSVTAMTGFEPEELLGAVVADLVGEEADRALELAVTDTLERPGSRSVELTIQSKDGREMWLESRPAPLLDPETGTRIGVTDVLRDITERKIAESKLEFANVLLTTQMEASPDGVLVVGADMKIISVNRRFAEMWGVPLADLVGGDGHQVLERAAILVKHPDAFLARARFIADNPEQDGREDVEMLDGRFLECYTVPLRGPAGANLGRGWFFSDVTPQRQTLAQALTAARQDVLTGLANRAVFVEALRREIAKSNRGERSFAVIYLDLDHFKDVNDTLGHPTGDRLLQAVADRLRANTRESDTVARFGGDEFAIIVSDLKDATDVAILAEKLIKVIGEPFSIAGTHVYTGVSIGIDLYGPESDDAETLLSHADLALYQAKARGRGGFQFFTPTMDRQVRGRVSMAAELREAIASDQLFLLYQPQVSVVTGGITGLEALVHWRHPRLGVLTSDAFIPTAEQMGLMGPLGHWVLWAATRQARAWLDADAPLTRLCVNLSAIQVKAQATLEAEIASAVTTTALPPGLLELQLSGAALAAASRENNEFLPRLRRAGVTIAITDFAAGNSSLHNVSRFPADRIKIPARFIKSLESQRVEAALVKATIGFARELNVMVLAAGVETREQFELLESWKCGEVQGPLIAAPVEADKVPALLVNGLPSAPWIEARNTPAPPSAAARRR